MKVSNRFRKLFFFTALFLIIYLVSEFKPKTLSAFTAIKEEYNLTSISYEKMNKNFELKKYYEDMEQRLLCEKYNFNVLQYLRQEEILKILQIYLYSNNINLTKINFSEALPVSINNSIDDSIIASQENDYYRILNMSVNIEFNSNYDNMLSFIDGLQNNTTDMSIVNISTTLSEENMVFVTMDINFYAISDI